LNETAFRQLVSGNAEGVGPTVLLALLNAASRPYGWAVSLRNRLYDRGWLASYSVSSVVVSVGNLTTGGTGKTPLVIWLANQLLARGRSCAILTRGYRTVPGHASDEPALLAKSCGGAEVIVNPNRVAAAQKAIQKSRPDVLILDDGFQHRRLRRDLDILAVDATCPFGYGKLLPAGLLREPVQSVCRAQFCVITRFDLATDEQIAEIEKTLRRFQPNLQIFHAVHKQHQAKTFRGRSIPVGQLAGQKAFVFCGIGNPPAFLRSLESLGIIPVGRLFFKDHHPYTSEDLDTIFRQAHQSKADLILTTEKDWVKTALWAEADPSIPFYYLPIELEFLTTPEPILQAVFRQIETKRIQVQP
jgi:tetraacyldisaccharide 4'-kinase